MRKLILFFAFIICGFYFSQGNSFVYEVRYKPNPAKDSIKTLKAVLDIKDNRSFFRTENQKKDDSIFGMLKDDKKDVDNMIRDLRKGRNFDI